MRFRILLLSLLLIPFLRAGEHYDYFLTGNSADVSTKTESGFALIGGGRDIEEPFRWMIRKSGGGDVVVIRAGGADGYNNFIFKLGGVDSVETLVIKTPEGARDPLVLDKLRKAEALFIAGGDQWNYVRLWRGGPVGAAIQELIDRGVPVGGTSAGLAVLGEFYFSAEHDTVKSPDAMADPFDKRVAVASGFLKVPHLGCLITDSHFRERDRMGRLLVFLARMKGAGGCGEVRGLGISERTAVLLEPDGAASVVGLGPAYLVRIRKAARVIQPGMPLTHTGFESFRLDPGGKFSLKRFRADGLKPAKLSVTQGMMSAAAGAPVY